MIYSYDITLIEKQLQMLLLNAKTDSEGNQVIKKFLDTKYSLLDIFEVN